MLARRQIGGYTGDVLGAVEQVGEIVMLLVRPRDGRLFRSPGPIGPGGERGDAMVVGAACAGRA